MHAIGGASNVIPRSGNRGVTFEARRQFSNEKIFELKKLGFDGSWVVHPLLIETMTKASMKYLKGKPN